MNKHTGAIVLFSIGVLFGVYCLISSICHHAKPISFVLDVILLVIFVAQLYLTLKGAREQDDQNKEQ